MDAEGEVLTSSVSRSVPAFEETAAALASIAELTKAEKEGKLAGDAAAKLLIARIDLGKLDLAEATKRRQAITGPLSDASKTGLDERLADLEVTSIIEAQQKATSAQRNELMQGMRPKPGGGQPSAEERAAVTKKLTALMAETTTATAGDLRKMLEAGRKPSDKKALTVWSLLLRDATTRKDAKAIEDAKAELQALAKRRPDQKAMVERLLNPQAPTRQIPATPLRAAGDEGEKNDAKKSYAKKPAASGKSK